MKKILFVHGINNQGNSSQNIITSWSSSILQSIPDIWKEEFENVSFHSCFYGDFLNDETESWGEIQDDGKKMGNSSDRNDYVTGDLATFYLDIQKKFNIKDSEIKTHLEEGNDIDYKAMAGGIHKKWLKALTKAILKVTPFKGKFAAKFFLKQAAAYLHKYGLKNKIDSLVKEQIESLFTEETIVISHSLGTIIMFDLLRNHSDWNSPLFITAGSPLGFQIVKNELGIPLSCLPNVSKWINLSDPEDFVVFESQLDKKTFGCDQITNIDDLDNGHENAHSIIEYLKHPRVGKEILKAIIDNR